MEVLAFILVVASLIPRFLPVIVSIAVVSVVAYVLFRTVRGDWWRKIAISAASCVALAALAIFLVQKYWEHLDGPQLAVQSERTLVESFVTGHAQVIAAASKPVRARVNVTRGPEKDPVGYDVYVDASPSPFYAIVDVNRYTQPITYSLACITRVSVGERRAGEGPCERAELSR